MKVNLTSKLKMRRPPNRLATKLSKLITTAWINSPYAIADGRSIPNPLYLRRPVGRTSGGKGEPPILKSLAPLAWERDLGRGVRQENTRITELLRPVALLPNRVVCGNP